MPKRIFGIVVLAIILPVVPILMFRHLPLVDYPNHLAELQIRKTITSNMHIASFYQFSWRFIPRLVVRTKQMTPFALSPWDPLGARCCPSMTSRSVGMER